MAKKTRSRLILCAEITADGKLVQSLTPLEYTDARIHRYEFFFQGASAIFSCDKYDQPSPSLMARSVQRILELKLLQPYPAPRRAAWRRDMRETLGWLWDERPGDAVCFGGPELFRAFLEDGLADELKLIVFPMVDGHRGTASLSGPLGAGFFPASVACRLLTLETQGDVCLLHYRVLRRRRVQRAAGA